MNRQLLFAAFLAALQGCATVGPPQPSTGARPPELVPIDVAGDYMHEPSHAVVPAEYAGFRRFSLFRRGPEGKRLTASFSGGSGPCPVAVTLFLDPAEQRGSVDKAYASARQEVTQAYPSAVLEREETSTDATPIRKRAFFLIDERRMEVGVVQNGTWDVKHRIIFPAACTEVVRPQINAFFPGWQR
jgi:hypothetical protein